MEFLVFLVVLGLDPRALHMLGEHSAAELHPQALNHGVCLLFFCFEVMGLNYEGILPLNYIPSPYFFYFETVFHYVA